MERLLSRTERVMFHLDRIYPTNFTTIGRVRGPLTQPQLRRALDAVAARHPFLTARIETDGAGEPWFRRGGPPPSLRWTSGADCIAEAEAEVNGRISGQGPLVRCVVVEHGPEDHTLMLTFNHCMSDGFSGVFVLRDLVQAAAAGEGSKALVALSDTRAMDHRFPVRARGLRGWWAQLAFALREVVRTLLHGRAYVVRDSWEVVAPQCRARWIPAELEPVVVQRLAERAKAERTTVHGALSAAMILAVVHEAKAGPLRIGFGSPVNLRAQLDPPVGQDVGLYVSAAAWGGMVGPEHDFWELARSVRRTNVEDQARAFPFAALGTLGPFFELLGGRRLAREVIARRMETQLRTTGGLTNLGRLDIETTFGPLEIVAAHFISSPSSLGVWISQATTLRDRLFWNFVWVDPALGETRARALAAATVKRLREAILPAQEEREHLGAESASI